MAGAYARLPRYFEDTDQVQDLESRLLTCMVALQGRSRAEATKRLFGNADRPSEMEYLVAYIVGQSRGHKMAAPMSHPKERAAYELGKKAFFYRAGSWDFSCASCHGEADKRIRMQDLPVLSQPAGAQKAYTTWPAYRVSNSQLKTHAVAHQRLLPPDALPRARVRFRSDHRAHALPRRHRQGRSLPRPGHQTMRPARLLLVGALAARARIRANRRRARCRTSTSATSTARAW